MQKSTILLCVLAVAFTASQVTAVNQCDEFWTYFQMTNSCYWAGDGLDFDAAEASCVNLGGHLASIHNSFENGFVATLTETGERQKDDQMTWIGLHFAGNNWQWTDGTNSAYQQWIRGDPKNVKKDDCVSILQDDLGSHKNTKGEWHNVECNVRMRKFVCKKNANY
ncbi:unnamed protein product [Auanema sp. JU1783]|nr:unnamed protein product [Auanema sp. JU1783]